MNPLYACSGPETLVPSALRGFRTWDLSAASSRLLLSSTGVPYRWTTGLLTAECAKWAAFGGPPPGVLSSVGGGCGCSLCRSWQGRPGAAAPPDHVAPVTDCSCGFYGWYLPQDTRIVPAPVFGVVEASGRVLMGSHGFRTEKIKLLAVAGLPPAAVPGQPRLVDELRSAGVGVFDRRDDLIEAFPPEDMSGLVDHTCDHRCEESAPTMTVVVPARLVAAMQASVQTSQKAFADTVRQLAQALSIPTDDAGGPAVPSKPPSAMEKALEARRNRNTGPQHAKRWWRR